MLTSLRYVKKHKQFYSTCEQAASIRERKAVAEAKLDQLQRALTNLSKRRTDLLSEAAAAQVLAYFAPVCVCACGPSVPTYF